ncbi:hypothetical protein [Magnetospirillum gryphiswaldense]|nr:hypothetical protein [Magnetospirillum gryphiswaldense]
MVLQLERAAMDRGKVNCQEFACLDAMRTARAVFFDEIVSHAQRYAAKGGGSGRGADGVAVAILRSENAYQIAEFYFLAEEFGLGSPHMIGDYIDRHNEDMRQLLLSPERLAHYGVRKERIEDAIFSEEEKAKVVENSQGGRLRLDQSDVARCLATMISPETCRKTLVAMGNGGLLERRSAVSVIITSTGILEGYFRCHLRLMSDMVIAGVK